MIYRVRGDNVRLVRFRSNNKLEIVIACFLFVIIIFISLMFYFKSYAVFREEKHFNVINGEVQDPGDIYFAYYVDDEITREIPKKGSGYTLDITKSTCTNGVSISFDENNYAVITSYENYNANGYTRTRCNLYFKKIDTTLSDYIKSLAMYNSYDLTIDEAGGNIRYIGVNPNNYVSVDGELWRIIGVMKNIDDGTGNKSDRVKLIRNESLGAYSWDSSDSSVNSGWGINEWSQADIMKLLNPGYESESVGGSLYWNSKSGNCFNGRNNQTVACNFSDSGMKSSLKVMVDTVLWNIGANDGVTYIHNNIITSKFYELERSSNNGKICSNDSYCNDDLVRTTTWTGKVGLMYPSDYGYATSGSGTIDRAICLNEFLYKWNNEFNDCALNSWLAINLLQSTVTPKASVNESMRVFRINYGNVDDPDAGSSAEIRPVVYLKPTVKIVSGIGTKENPFVIGN